MKRKKALQTTPTEYPSGICVKTESGHWYINGKFRHALKNRRIIESWSFPFIVESTDAALANYPKAKPLGFRDGSLVRDISDGKVYLITSRSRRLITSPETYDLLGLKRSDATWAAHDEITLHPEGEVL